MYSIVSLLIGSIFLGIASTLFWHLKVKHDTCNACVTAYVVDFHRQWDIGDDNRLRERMSPVYEYTIGQTTFRATSRTTYGMPKHTIGQKVMLRVNPNNPEEIYEEQEDLTKTVAIFFVIVGIILYIIAALPL